MQSKSHQCDLLPQHVAVYLFLVNPVSDGRYAGHNSGGPVGQRGSMGKELTMLDAE